MSARTASRFALVFAALLAGCGGGKCKTDTVLVSFVISGQVQNAQWLAISASVGDATQRTSRLALSSGTTSGTFEVYFPSGYPHAGQLVHLRIDATDDAGRAYATASTTVTVAHACEVASIEIAPTHVCSGDSCSGVTCNTGTKCDPCTGSCAAACDEANPCADTTASCCAGLCTDTTANSNACGACGAYCGDDADHCAGSACACGAGPACGTGNLCCGGVCVPSDGTNCGTCGVRCGAGESCNALVGSCSCGTTSTHGGPSCGASQSCCGGVCLDAQNDPTNCGGCGVACGSGIACKGGKCDCTSAGCVNPGQLCCMGGCISPDTDEGNCGACGVTCGASELCLADKCSCNTNTMSGGPACVAPAQCCPSGCADVQTSAGNCGACGRTCDAASTTGCAAGACTCKFGYAPSADPSRCTLTGRLVNASTRLNVLTGASIAIAGFIIRGTGTKKLIFRVIGPSLGGAGIADPLMNPKFDVYQGGTIIASNDDWASGAGNTMAELIAAGKQPPDAVDPALVLNLAPGAYTVQVQSVGGGTGVAVLELYDLDPANAPTRLANFSTRGQARTGEGQMIGGFVTDGSDNRQLLTRMLCGAEIGGIPTANQILMPAIDLEDSGAMTIASNTGWMTDAQQASIPVMLRPGNSNSSALLRSVTPGPYTVVVHGVATPPPDVGLGIFEVYDLAIY